MWCEAIPKLGGFAAPTELHRLMRAKCWHSVLTPVGENDARNAVVLSGACKGVQGAVH
jgi:hypothetical protein